MATRWNGKVLSFKMHTCNCHVERSPKMTLRCKILHWKVYEGTTCWHWQWLKTKQFRCRISKQGVPDPNMEVPDLGYDGIRLKLTHAVLRSSARRHFLTRRWFNTEQAVLTQPCRPWLWNVLLHWMLSRPRCRRSKSMHSAELEVVYQILSGASLLMSFHVCRQRYDVTCS